MSGWNEQDVIDRDRRLLDEEERIRAAAGFLEALSEMVGPTKSIGDLKPPRKPRAHPERDLEKACSDLLALDGWRMLKTDPCSDRRRGKGFGEMGMADCLYIRYDGMGNVLEISVPVLGTTEICVQALCQVLWIEYKVPGGKPTRAQEHWHMAERARGALTWIVGRDFPATVDGFLAHYRTSGLMRRTM